jgi:hypothetical protein
MNLNTAILKDPTAASLADAYITINMLLRGEQGDADPGMLIQSAIDSLRSALAAMPQAEAVA